MHHVLTDCELSEGGKKDNHHQINISRQIKEMCGLFNITESIRENYGKATCVAINIIGFDCICNQ